MLARAVDNNYAPLAACADLMVIHRHVAGELICGPTTPAGLFIVKEGLVRLFRLTADGREVTLSLASAGDVFGVLAPETAEMTFAEVLEPAVVCVVDDQTLTRVFSQEPAFAISLLRRFSDRLGAAEARVQELAFATAPQRIARALLRRCDGRPGQLRTTHADLAKDAAVARETVTKVLADLESTGAVATRRRSVRILQPALLHRMADGPSPQKSQSSDPNHISRPPLMATTDPVM